MFGKRIKIFSLLGFEVNIEWSWIIIAILVVWSLSTGFFPYEYENLSPGTYWMMGIIAALGLFISIIVHEFSHSLVARKYDIHMKGITLFIFGGVAEAAEDPPNAKAEFMMSIVGPVSSVAIGLVFHWLSVTATYGQWPDAVSGIVRYIAFINFLLAGFNLIPAFPLDGGRVFRAILWHFKGNLRWATRIASQTGYAFGMFLVALGLWRMLSGNLIGGMWIILIGFFIQNAARMSYQQILIRRALEGEPVRRFMEPNPVTVPPSCSVEQLIEDYVYRTHHKMYPVVEFGRLIGCVSVKQIKQIPKEQRAVRSVAEFAAACSEDNTIPPDADAVEALSRMSRTGLSRLMVVLNGQLVGIISLKDLLKFLSVKMELGE